MDDKMLIEKLREIGRFDAAQILERLVTEGGEGFANGSPVSYAEHADLSAADYLDCRFTWAKIPAFQCSTADQRRNYWSNVQKALYKAAGT